MVSTLLALALFGQQQIIWIGDKNLTNNQLRATQVSAIVFYDDTNHPRLIIINPDPGPGPGPGPTPPPAPPSIPDGQYGVAPVAYAAVRDAQLANKISREEITKMVDCYRATEQAIRSALAGAPNSLTMNDAQNKLINKTRETLGSRLPAWVPVLDLFLKHMKTKLSAIKTPAQLADYYGEIANGMEILIKI